MTMPEAVVFDIGGVLLDWNPRHLYRKLFADEAAMEHFLTHICSPDWNLEQDKGRPWDEAIRELSAEHPDHAPMIEAYRARWPETVAGAIHDTVMILEELRAAGVPLYAITNFAADTFALAQERFGFLNRFRDVVVSGAEGVLKPQPEIYGILFERQGLAPETLVFIDDAEKNVAGARAVGMSAIHFRSPDQLRGDLVGLGFRQLAA